MIPFEMSVRVTNSSEGYVVTVTLESKDSSKPITVSQKRIYADLDDMSDLRQEAIDEYTRKAGEIQ
jgi:DNA-binding protein YbaB